MKKARSAQTRKHRWRRGILLFFCTALSVIFLGVSFGGLCLYGYIERHPEKFTADLSLFSDFSVGNAAAFYYFPKNAVGEWEDPRPDLSGAVLLEDAQIDGGRTHYVPITEIPTDLQNAFVAIEDKRFYTHSGVDLRRTAAAVLSYLKKGSGGFGGSTITQQLVKNVTGENARTPMRKLSEILRAIDLERYFEKSEILERYLNVVPLANGIVGVGKAAERYYGKSASELTLAECASIAAITQNPSRYDPVAHPEENKVRRDCILSEMLAQGYIKEDAYLAAVASPVVTVAPDRDEKRVNSWYTDLVIADVIEDLTAAYGYTRAEASRLVYYGNLHIYTFVDPKLQRVVEEYYQKEANFPRLANGNAPASAMIVLDPETGNILAVAGAIGEKTADRVYNFATDAKRPPGSVLKPATVYAPALQRGIIHYASVYDDVPVRFTEGRDGTFRAWPHNASGVYRGLSNIDVAVRNSLNTVAVRVLEDLGIDAAFSFARDVLGITSLVENERGKSDKGLAALALGQTHYGVTLREMTAAYTAFTNGGVYRNARSYAVVCDGDGNVLLENEGVMRPALSESTAELMTKLLENVTKNGTARALTLTDTTAVAGKTGTTQNTFDRWFIGYTPKLLAGVWYGCEYPESLESVSGNPSLSIWDGV
ncbi:MAG: transglycosylase domain-containing protein, partial [Clostridia bacterium]|nr:transglycosylase domain-containing protein [Clostridia bacterium]